MNRVQLLNLLITQYNYSSYLELGVDKGHTFQSINLADKTGVDINSSRATYRISTDEFFSQCNRKFDIIFIDALHTYKQALIDFNNSLEVLNTGGCIVLHDCLPITERHQLPEPQRRHWTGDVWKAMVRIRQIPDVRSYVIDADWGLGVVFRGTNETKIGDVQDTDLTWNNYLKYKKEWLGIVNYDYQICQR